MLERILVNNNTFFLHLVLFNLQDFIHDVIRIKMTIFPNYH